MKPNPKKRRDIVVAYRCLWALLWLLHSQTVQAATFKIGSLGGLMTQPTSNYFHAVYGAVAEVAREDGKLAARVGYLERPQFKSAGFVDQEFFGYAQIGTRLTRSKNHGLWAFFGGGQSTGFIRAEQNDVWNGATPPTRRHHLPGLSLAMEYAYRWGGFEVAMGHQILVGYTSKEHLKAYVAWPYHFLLLRTGVVF